MLPWINKNTNDAESSWSLVKGGWNIRSQNYKLQWKICKILFLTYALQVNFGRIWNWTIFIYPKKMLNRKHLPTNLGTKAWEISKPSLHQQPNVSPNLTTWFLVHHFDDEKKTHANHGNPAPKKWSSGWLIIVVSAKDDHRDKLKLGPWMSLILQTKRFRMIAQKGPHLTDLFKNSMELFVHFHRGWIFPPKNWPTKKPLGISSLNRFFLPAYKM